MRFFFITILFIHCLFLRAQNPLAIPPVLTGKTFNLNVQNGTKIFYGSTPTPTYGINGGWMAPTIIVNKGDSIVLNVINNLNVKTTMHWHGLHIAAINDGGPHQVIYPSTTWSPSFKIRNNASTFWYHPHGEGQTEQQVSKGLAGLLIVKDSAEALLTLPRTYGIDDIPIIVQNKAFDALKQIAIATDMDTALFVNGTLNPYFNAPAQVIRFRILNGSSLRSYNFGLGNGQLFYQIGTDGGLLDTPIVRNRLLLSPGERAEVLINFSGMSGQTVFLKSFGSELPTGIYGAKNIGMGVDTIPDYKENFLNGADFNLLRINISSATTGAITSIPATLVPLLPYSILSATKHRTIVMDTIRLLSFDAPNRAEGPFGMNNKSFDIDSINQVVYLNTTETWTLVNKTLVAHPFHIHDVQFNVIEKTGLPVSTKERGWKDVVLVMPNDRVKFITRFADFADNTTPYMFHCHLLHHEDDGMMGSFKVINAGTIGISEVKKKNFTIYPNPAGKLLTLQIDDALNNSGNENIEIEIRNVLGDILLIHHYQIRNKFDMDISDIQNGMYLLKIISGKNSFTTKLIKQ